MPTSPTPLPTIPPFPALADKATGTYNSKAYDWATGWKDDIAPAIEALADNAYDNAVEGAASAAAAAASASTATTQAGTATTQASAASASAVAAAASASAATNAANVQGTSTSSVAVATAVGQSRSFTYVESSRAIAVGMHLVVAVTASPTTNWMLIQVSGWDSGTRVVTGTVITYAGIGTYAAWTLSLSGPRGAAGAAGADALVTMPSLALSGSVTLVLGNNGYVGDVAGGAVITLDTLSTLGDGWGITLVPASPASQPVVTADFGSGAETRILAGVTDLTVKQVGGVFSVRWVPRGNAVPVFGGLGTPAVINAIPGANVAVCAISSTRSIGFYSSSSTRPRAVLLNSVTGAVISTSADIEAVAMSGATVQVVRVDDTYAVAIWAVSGAVKAVVLWNNADAIAFGTPLQLEGVNSSCQAIAALTAGKLLCVWGTTSSTLRAATVTISGTTLTLPGAIYTLYMAATPSQCRVSALSATLALVTFAQSTTVTTTFGLPLTEAANVLTFPASAEAIFRAGTANAIANSDVCALTSSTAVVVAGHSKVNSGDAAAMTVTVTGTGATAKLQVGPQRPISTPSSLPSAHRLAKVNATTLLHAFTVDAGLSSGSTSIQALYVEGDAVRPGAAKNLARNVGAHDLGYSTANRWYAQTIYVDADNSSYPTSQSVNLGSVV